MPAYSSATSYLTYWALQGLRGCYIQGKQYTKSGIILTQLSTQTAIQTGLLHYQEDKKQISLDKAMKAFDAINHKWGSGTITTATIHQKERPWLMKQQKKSGGVTTNWDDIVCI